MLESGLYWALILVLTGLSNIPTMIFSIWLMGKSEWLKKQFRSQLMDLPILLSEPVVEVAIKNARERYLKMSGAETSEQVTAKVMAAVEGRIVQLGESLNTQTAELLKAQGEAFQKAFEEQSGHLQEQLKGTYGQMVKKTKAELTQGEGPLGEIVSKLLQSNGGGVKDAADSALSIFR